jgi:23S rRNA (cytidine1920-2'-O)/16S rRNA (cytidine1409-2'-O)-methyltransferase
MKQRLDVILINQGYATSREKARAIIMSGNVFVKGQREDKAGSTFEEEGIDLLVKGNPLKYVSRGGLKLEKALSEFPIELEGKVCMDIGASTGGFTDCMLQNGAIKVFAVDVGTNQLAWKLRSDERVISMEQTNIRYVTPEDIGEQVDFVSIDVAFISLTKVLEPVRNLMKPGAEIVCLIKPQFEAGRDKVGKKGVVREPEVHKEVVHRIFDFMGIAGFDVLHLDYSPIKGPEGNIE